VLRKRAWPAGRRPRQARARPSDDRQPGAAAAALHRRPDAIAIAEQKAKDLQEQANAFRDLSTSVAREDAKPRSKGA